MTPQWLTAVTALVAVIVGPLISLFIAKQQNATNRYALRKQIEASTVSANRQTWINTLRDSIAEVQSLVTTVRLRNRRVRVSSQCITTCALSRAGTI